MAAAVDGNAFFKKEGDEAPFSGTEEVEPGRFHAENHFYDRCLNATPHPTIVMFEKFASNTKRVCSRYCHLNPNVAEDDLRQMLEYVPRYFRWAGSDMFLTTTGSGHRDMVVIECNSSASGQKSYPRHDLDDDESMAGYARVEATAFRLVEEGSVDVVPDGVLAVLWDKNLMETSGYAATLANEFDEPCYLVEYHHTDENPSVKFVDGVIWVRVPCQGHAALHPRGEPTTFEDAAHVWLPVRACQKYVTQKPWTCFPPVTKTRMMNPVVTCLAGGRNKLVAAKAYELFNSQFSNSGIQINYPATYTDLNVRSVPIVVNSLGGCAVVKVPYSNGGQGVYTITCDAELQEFMSEAADWPYENLIVQALIGNKDWSSRNPTGEPLYHVGTVPNANGDVFVADLRMMVAASDQGYKPVAMYGRRARKPLVKDLAASSCDSWSMLGTNLSTSMTTTTTKRLLLMDTRDFGKLGLSFDDLVQAYVQTVCAAIAIDLFSRRLMGALNPGKTLPGVSVRGIAAEDEMLEIQEEIGFDIDLFASVNSDKGLLSEICIGIALADPQTAEAIRDSLQLE